MKGITNETIELAKHISMLILDVDGVLTDGSIILDNEGNELKVFNVKDGHGIKMLINEGINVAIITGRTSGALQRRARELGINDVYQGCDDKVAAYEDLKINYALHYKNIACVGDDIADIPLMTRVGLPVAVGDAVEDIKQFARLVTSKEGGRGAVRQVCDFLLKSKGILKGIIDDYGKA
ncbi:KdsC family phosphatase [Candidatus Magnetominusculus dajiuhuensis]|uniref:KdsC family phosphatase n=1 Tax=Candidatus Magnetominusculus dajiuhuensis TaxID=3137712 RepID=UPI003B43C37E